MKIYRLIFLLLFSTSWATAQKGQLLNFLEANSTEKVKPTQVFSPFIKTREDHRVLTTNIKVTTGSVYEIDPSSTKEILSRKPQSVLLNIPNDNNQTVIQLHLIKVNLFSSNALITDQSGRGINIKPEVHYQGVITGQKRSVAAISFLADGSVSGLVSGENIELVIGKIENRPQHVIYNPDNIKESFTMTCGVADTEVEVKKKENARISLSEEKTGSCKTIGVYFEIDYNLFQKKGNSIQNTITFFSAVFNQVKLLYANEEINIEIAGLKVWNEPDPYRSVNNTSILVSNFRNNQNGAFPGHLATLISGRYEELTSGGIAYDISEDLCNKKDMVTVCGIQDTFENIPTYSWTVFVIAHEMGHILGSRHTHWCGWDGGPIDGCSGFAESDDSGQNCSAGPIPSNGGTIMSYCHLKTVGVNFSLGFGEQPGNLIRSKINNSTCMNSADPTDIIEYLTVDKVTGNKAKLSWNIVPGAEYYQLEYKKSADSGWSHSGYVFENNFMITDLSFDTSYDWRIKTNCSDYTVGPNFKTEKYLLEINEPLPIETVCKNSTITFNYSAMNFLPGNEIIVELSDSSGSFSDSTIVGMSISSSPGGVISAIIPQNLDQGNNYRLRLKSNFPIFQSEPSPPISILNENQNNFNLFQVSVYDNTSLKINLSIKHPAQISYIVVAKNDHLKAPDPHQIIEGIDDDGLPALQSGIFLIEEGNIEKTFIIEELFEGIEYVVFATLDDSTDCMKPIVADFAKTTGGSLLTNSCYPYLDCNDDDIIDTFAIPGIGLRYEKTACSNSGYTDRTNYPYLAKSNTYYPFYLKLGLYPQYVRIWIDRDNNGVFDEEELVYSSGTNKINGELKSCLLLPDTQGPVRLRVMVTYYYNIDPCYNTYDFGEAEDFMLYLTDSPVYMVQTHLTSPIDDLGSGMSKEIKADLISASHKLGHGASATLESTASIDLKPGFIAEKGSVFRAEIQTLCGTQ